MTRLHPLSPVLKGLRFTAAAIVIISWRGIQELGFGGWLLAVAALFVVLMAYSAIAYRFTGYEIIGRELRIHEGVLARRVRAVPLERLQSIEVSQPALARPFGLAELKLDLAGSGKAEAPLAYLKLPEARALRAHLLALSAGHTETAPQSEPDEEPLFAVSNDDVVKSQLLTPPLMFTPLAVLYVIGQLFYNQNFGFFAIASMLTAVVGTAGRPVLGILNFWNFKLGRAEDGKLHIRHGLIETRSQTVAPRRIQSMTVTWPLLWRGKGWLRITLAVAGQSSNGGGGEGQRKAETDRLLPVGTMDQARALVPYVMPGVDISALPLTRVTDNARWLAPLRHKILAAGLTEHVFASVDGYMTRTLTIVPYGRIQSIRLTQGPWQRRLDLATVHVDIAGGSPITAPHRTVAEAAQWAADLTQRARAARDVR